MPRFALLHHDHPVPHYDLLLQIGSVAWTWRLTGLPGVEPVPAERIADHRLFYLDYEGEVPGGRGQVVSVDQGEYSFIHLELDRLAVKLAGTSLRGVLRIESGEARIQDE